MARFQSGQDDHRDIAIAIAARPAVENFQTGGMA